MLKGRLMVINIRRTEKRTWVRRVVGGGGAGTERRDGILVDFLRSWSATSRCPPPIPPNHNKAKALIGIKKLILLQFAHTRTNVLGLSDTHKFGN